MAVSGSNDYSRSATQLVTQAFKKLRRVGVGQSATADMVSDGIVVLNDMIKSWQKYEWLWNLQEGSATLVADQANYTLSPRPYRVVSVRFDDQDTEIPMIPLTREEYFDLPVKTTQGIPTQYYVDYQRDSAVMYVWPVMSSVDDETINYTYRELLDDIDATTDNIDFRQEHYELVVYNLAARLADDYGRADVPTNRVIARAEMLLDEARDDDREEEIRFVAGWY